MAGINTFEQGAKILENVDVTSMVTGLALGIAEAQEQLDNNSVNQITRLAQTQVGGKSLLELGFRPAFYSFDYADVSASISLKMAVKDELAVDFSLEYDSTKKKGYTDEQIQKLENSYKEEKYRAFKSSRKFWTTVSNEHTLQVNGTSVATSTQTGSIDRVEETANRLSSDSEVERVDSLIIDTQDIQGQTGNTVHIHNYQGFGMLAMADYYAEDLGIVKVKDYGSGITIGINNSKDISGGNLSTCLGSIANSTFKMGLADGDQFTVYFDFSKHRAIDFSYSAGAAPNNTDALQGKLRALARIMKADAGVKITITGHTDSVSGDAFNKALGLKRANGVANYLLALGVDTAQITDTLTKGEEAANTANEQNQRNPDFRKAVITVNTGGSEYIYVEGGDFSHDDSAAKVNFSTAEFGILEKHKQSTGGLALAAKSADTTITSASVTNLAAAATAFGNTNKFYHQVSGDALYVLRQDAKIEYTLFSSNSEEIVIEDKSSSNQNTQNSNDTLDIHKVINSKYFAKTDLKQIKDPKVSAWSGSLDFRYARQFGMSVEGNASISARMVSIPAPTGFENYVQSLTGTTNPPTS